MASASHSLILPLIIIIVKLISIKVFDYKTQWLNNFKTLFQNSYKRYISRRLQHFLVQQKLWCLDRGIGHHATWNLGWASNKLDWFEQKLTWPDLTKSETWIGLSQDDSIPSPNLIYPSCSPGEKLWRVNLD